MNHEIKQIGKGSPRIVIIGGVHGDELIGRQIIKDLRKLEIYRGSLLTIIANPLALKKKKRFIKQDLNRSFPGRKNGNYEEKIAYAIRKTINNADFVIDIHSTTTDVKNLGIITKINRSVLKLIDIFRPAHLALMKRNIGKHSLTYFCRAGIVLEYGGDKNKSARKNILNDILSMFQELGMIDNLDVKNKINKQNFYKITGTVKKREGFILNKKIKNFKLVKGDDIIAGKAAEKIKAKNNFYPILFGGKAYKDIYGFSAKKVKKF